LALVDANRANGFAGDAGRARNRADDFAGMQTVRPAPTLDATPMSEM
jgi:hypothetical protein